MGGKPAAIPLFADAYLADTTHLTTEEHGAYLLLLMAAWRQDDCGLPNDDRKLARIAGLTPRKWASIKPTIMAFWTLSEGRYAQARLRREHDFVCKKSEANRKAALSRWEPQEPENKRGGGMRLQCDRNAPPPPPSIPLSNDNGPTDDPDKVFWDAAKGYLGASKASLISRLCGEYGREAVSTAITTAMLTSPQPPDRTAWLIGILKRGKATSNAGEIW